MYSDIFILKGRRLPQSENYGVKYHSMMNCMHTWRYTIRIQSLPDLISVISIYRFSIVEKQLVKIQAVSAVIARLSFLLPFQGRFQRYCWLSTI